MADYATSFEETYSQHRGMISNIAKLLVLYVLKGDSRNIKLHIDRLCRPFEVPHTMAVGGEFCECRCGDQPFETFTAMDWGSKSIGSPR